MAKPNPLSPVVTLTDPPTSLQPVQANKGGTIQWRSESINYPKFEIQFNGANPADGNQNKKIHGDTLHPVVIAANTINPAGQPYEYTITQYDTGGSPTVTGPDPLYVTGCPYC